MKYRGERYFPLWSIKISKITKHFSAELPMHLYTNIAGKTKQTTYIVFSFMNRMGGFPDNGRGM